MQLKDGEVVIFNTDTVYGIGCKYLDLKGYEKVYDLKKRPKNKQMSVLFSSILEIAEVAILNDKTIKIMKNFFPGGLTLILPVKKNHPYNKIAHTIGVRIPANPLAISIIKENGPLATSSVNISGFPPLNNLDEIKDTFKDADYIISDDDNFSDVASTVIDATSDNLHILREGMITLEEINKIL